MYARLGKYPQETNHKYVQRAPGGQVRVGIPVCAGAGNQEVRKELKKSAPNKGKFLRRVNKIAGDSSRLRLLITGIS